MTRPPRSAFIAAVLACTALGAVVVALSARAEAKKPAPKAPVPAAQQAPVSVQMAPVQTVQAAPREDVTGSLEPARQLQLGFEVGGRLARILVAKGAPVAEGQVIAQLDPEISDAQVAQAEAGLKAAEAQAAVAADTARRQAELRTSGGVSEWQQRSADGQAQAAAAQVLAVKAQLAQARAARRRHDLRAPFAGVLVASPDQVGGLMGPGATPFTLEQLDPLTLRVTVPEAVRAQVKPGARVRVESVTGGASIDQAVVKTVIPSADPGTRRVPVEITVPNKDGRFTAHTMARARLTLGQDEIALSVPSSALASTGGDHVFVLGESGQVRKVAVQVIERGTRQVVLRAPEKVTRVIDNPAIDLVDGARVTVQ